MKVPDGKTLNVLLKYISRNASITTVRGTSIAFHADVSGKND